MTARLRQALAFAVFMLLTLPHCLTGSERRMTASQFPLTIGSWWRYVVADSSAGTIDTIRVRARSAATISDGRQAILLQYEARGRIDSHYVARTGDTVTLYRSRNADAVEFRLIFPISPGKTWSGNPPGEVRVVRLVKTVVPAKVFAHAFELHHRPAVRNFVGGNYLWIVSGVGIVRFSRRAVDTTIPATTAIEWRLISWHIARESHAPQHSAGTAMDAERERGAGKQPCTH